MSQPDSIKVEDHPFFGNDKENDQSVQGIADNLRKQRDFIVEETQISTTSKKPKSSSN